MKINYSPNKITHLNRFIGESKVTFPIKLQGNRQENPL